MKKPFSAAVTLWVVLIMVFALGPVDGISGTPQTGALTKGSDMVPLNSQSNMLQFRAGGHILGFQPTRAYLASLDHALSVEFLHTKGVMPQSTTGTTTTNSLTNAPALTKVSYENLWKGINLTYETAQDGITESTYHIAPNADVSQIRLRYNVPVTAQKDGSLKFTFEKGYLTESKPVAWQDINGKRIPVSVAFNVSDDEVGFSVGTYNPREPLVIDPTYAWHTFSGASDYDGGFGIAVDNGGNVYIAGTSITTWGEPLHAYSGSYDIVVLKLNSSGAFQWHTFYGSSSEDTASGIVVDTDGNVYVTGESRATWGEPLRAYSGKNDIFVLKLNSDGAYQWHTFYGSSDYDVGLGITVDTGGNVYVTGQSSATWGSPLHAHSGNGSSDIFVLKLDSSGARYWHTFYGSSGSDAGYGIAIYTGGNVYVTGVSGATWGTPLHAHSGGDSDIFVLKLNSSGGYQWHTFYGSSNTDFPYGIAVDTDSNIYVTGWSDATWGSPLNAHSGSREIFVLKLNSSGALLWNTFYYGSSDTYYYGYTIGIAVDNGGNVYITGTSATTWGSPLHAYSGSSDICILMLNSSGTYQWHTFYGSSYNDVGYDVVVDTVGNVYVTGQSSATWGSPLHAHSGNGSSDIFVLKLNPTDTCTITVDPNPDSLNAPWTLTGPNAFSHSFNGDAVEGYLDPGEYTVTWGDVAGWETPASQTRTLAAGDSITFTGNYQHTPVIPTPPAIGIQGYNITINGSSFGAQGNGYVDFNGVQGTIVSWSDTQIVVTVPYGATTGCMTVVTDYGTSDCMDFTVGNPACFPPVKLSNYDYFDVVQDAYDNVTAGSAVLLQTGTFMGNVLLDRNITTILQGGYNCSYDYNPGYSTIKGSLTITKGTVTVDKLIIAATSPGFTWTEQTASCCRGYKPIASSADGMKLVTAVGSWGDDSYIYTSTDSGFTWTERTGAGGGYWYSVASSADGTKLAAANNWRGGYSVCIYTSTDSGASWTEQTASGSRNWSAIASSADGTKLAAAVDGYGSSEGGYIYTSNDSGATWTEQAASGSRNWSAIASSADGTKLAATVGWYRDGYIYTSTDSGTTWTERTSAGSRTWQSIASSDDGTKLAAVVGRDAGGYIYTSTNSGATWTERTRSGSRTWHSIASSADGTKLAAVHLGGSIYTSNDSGATWTEQTSAGSRGWVSIASSADGTKLAVTTWYGSIWTGVEIAPK